jgi:hypothetical protein
VNNGNFSYPDGGLGIPFSYDAALRSLPAYCASHRTGSLLDPLAEFLNDGTYILGIRSIPSTQQQNASNLIQPNQTYEDNITVPEGSCLMMIGAVGLDGTQTGVQTASKFRVRLFDVGSQSYLSDDFVHMLNIGGNISAQRLTGQPFYGQQQFASGYQGIGADQLVTHGLFILPSPIFVSSPGQLTVQIVNLSNSANTVDMAFYFALPIGNHQAISPASVSGNFNRKGH